MVSNEKMFFFYYANFYMEFDYIIKTAQYKPSEWYDISGRHLCCLDARREEFGSFPRILNQATP